MPSVKKNIILNGINTVTSVLFPMITFPYAARVLMPDGIGLFNFQSSIINYIVLLTSLGIPLYAVKEIGRFRDDKSIRDKTTIELIILSFVLSIIGYGIVWIIATFIPQIHRHVALFYVLSLTISFNAIGVTWFYQGVEDFKFITIRAICVRILSVIALFILVKDAQDILIYGFITVGATVGNNLINFIHLHKYVDITHFKLNELNVVRHIKPAIQTFLLNLIVSLYVQISSIMLGFISGDEAVGYFTAGTKITYVCFLLITSIGTVLLPRCSNLIEKGDSVGFANMVTKSAQLIVGISLPMIIGLSILAVPIVLLFCGKDYEASVIVLRLNAPVILFTGLTNVMGKQILYPMNRLNIVIRSVTAGAIVNLLFNFLLMPTYGATGAAISSLIAEFVVLAIQLICGREYYPFKWKNIFDWRYFVASVNMGLVVLILHYVFKNYIVWVSMSIVIGATIYIITLYFFKEKIIRDNINFILNKRLNGKI